MGIEVPNRHKELVSLRDLIESEEFKKSESPLTVALGRDVAVGLWSGIYERHPIFSSPELLVQVKCVHQFHLTSLLYRATPNDLRIGLVDPKEWSFLLFGLPHLCAPVISELGGW